MPTWKNVSVGIKAKFAIEAKHTTRNTSVARTQETASIVARKPSFERDLTAVGSRNGHGNPAHVCSHGLRGRTATWWTIGQRQVRPTSDIVGEVNLNIGQVNLVCESGTMQLESILTG